jgi:hypothetical protein
MLLGRPLVPLLAQSGHCSLRDRCPLLGVKRTFRFEGSTFPKRVLDRSRPTKVMRLLRLVLEQEKLRDSFPHVALYCDRLLHNEIDRHEIAIEILCQMHAAIVDWDRTHETNKGAEEPERQDKKKLGNAVAEMIRISKKMGSNHWARAFFVTYEPHEDKRMFFWTVECEKPDLVGTDHINIKGELRMTEQPNDFRRP